MTAIKDFSQSLLIEAETALAESEAKCEKLQLQLSQRTADVAIEKAARVAAENACVIAERAKAKAEQSLATFIAERDSSEENAEAAVMSKLVSATDGMASKLDGLITAANKPPVIVQTPVIAKTEPTPPKSIRAIVRERDANGKALVVDINMSAQ